MLKIGELYANGRLFAKTIDRISVEPDSVSMTSFKVEGKLLTSPAGDCLSSGTLLAKNVPVPTYGINGRCYGLLFDASQCDTYAFYENDGNTNRDTKLVRRAQFLHRQHYDAQNASLFYQQQLDMLHESIKKRGVSQLNEVVFDAKAPACIGLFMRQINLSTANFSILTQYYSALVEILLIRKLFIQAFGFAESFNIYLYDEKAGKLFAFTDINEIKLHAQVHHIDREHFPMLFHMLSDSYQFKDLIPRSTVREFIRRNMPREATILPRAFLYNLLRVFKPFHGARQTATRLMDEIIDDHVGVTESQLEHAVQLTQNQLLATRLRSPFFSRLAPEEKGDTFDENKKRPRE